MKNDYHITAITQLRWVTSLLATLFSLSVYAQFESTIDSLSLPQMDSIRTVNYPHEDPKLYTGGLLMQALPYPSTEIQTLDNMPVSKFATDFKSSNYILTWNGGNLKGNHDTDIYYDLGALSHITAEAQQNLGNIQLTATTSLFKNNLYRDISNGFSGGISVAYNFNSNVGVTAFGNISTQSILTRQAATAYQYGGFFSLTTNNNKWGIDLGAQRYFNPYNGQWSTAPIVMPYYKFHGQKLGVDFGGLLKNIFIHAGESASPHTIKPTPAWKPGMPRPNKW